MYCNDDIYNGIVYAATIFYMELHNVSASAELKYSQKLHNGNRRPLGDETSTE